MITNKRYYSQIIKWVSFCLDKNETQTQKTHLVSHLSHFEKPPSDPSA